MSSNVSRSYGVHLQTSSSPIIAKSRWLLRGACLGAATLLVCLSASANARSLLEIQTSNELRACVAYVSPYQGKVEPPGCRANCTATGDVADLVESFAMTLGNGIKPKVISIDWNEQFADASGKVDREAAYTPKLFAESTCDFYATGLYRLAWRIKKMDMVTINPSRHMIVVRAADKSSLKNANDLAGKTAVTYKNSSYHTWLDEQNSTTYKANPIRIIFVADEPQALAALNEGKADFTVLVADDAVPEVRKTQDQFAIAFPAGSIMEMSWAFRKEDKDLQRAANDFFQAQRANTDSLLNKQFDNLYGMSVSEFSKMVSDNDTEGQVQR